MNNLQFQDLINLYLRGQISDSESESLKDLLQNKTNMEYFEEVKREWELNPELDELGQFNLTRLQYQINSEKFITRSLKSGRSLWIRVASVAAILAIGLLIGSSIFYLISSEKKSDDQIVIETPRGEKSKVKLPDGSEVWLNANSKLVYHDFSARHRLVELTGEAFFKVVHNDQAPFIVRTNECDVEDLGTTFNVMAYNEFGRKEITLIEGKLNVKTPSSQEMLKPGQALILKDHQMKVVETNVSEASAWVENKFNFRNIPLPELMKRLENWYDVDINFENRVGKDVRFTGTFKNEETIWQVLDAIKIYVPIQYTKTNLRQIKITVE
jgi:transmembrane sensor